MSEDNMLFMFLEENTEGSHKPQVGKKGVSEKIFIGMFTAKGKHISGEQSIDNCYCHRKPGFEAALVLMNPEQQERLNICLEEYQDKAG